NQMLDLLQNPEITNQMLIVLKGQQFREHLEKTIQETIETPLFQSKIQHLLLEAAEKQQSEEDKKENSKKSGEEDKQEKHDGENEDEDESEGDTEKDIKKEVKNLPSLKMTVFPYPYFASTFSVCATTLEAIK